MTIQEFIHLTETKIVILDGATGSNLQNNGMPAGVCPEQWILEHKEKLIQLQLAYLNAGTDILYTPTFSGNRLKLMEYGLEDQISYINHELTALSKEAINRFYKQDKTEKKRYIAGNLTMTGVQLYPIGTLRFEQLVEIYKEQIIYLAESGVDLLIVETMMSLPECRAALIAAKEVCSLPVMVTLSFEENGRTLYGTEPKTAVVVLQSLGAAAVGVNCSAGPEMVAGVLKELKNYAQIPIIVKPNAGLPKLINGKSVYEMTPEEFAEKFKLLLEAGANLVGGCCGSTPAHIACLSSLASNYKPFILNMQKKWILATERRLLEFDLSSRFLVVGERINPTGKKTLQEKLKEGKLEIVLKMAEEQLERGADILDINMGMNGINEKEMMVNAVYEVIQGVDLPISIDSSHVDVIEAALRIYPGRALINSISLEPEKCSRLIPIAKKYGAMFILLPLSERGLPKDLEEKKNIIHELYNMAEKAGMCAEDIIVDGLVNTVGANKDASIQTIETIRYCKEELGLATTVGLSNISFGLPERQFINSTFLAIAIQAGLTMAIANPSQELLMNTALATDLLRNTEAADIRYIEKVRKIQESSVKEDGKKEPNGNLERKIAENISDQPAFELNKVYEAVLKGNRRMIIEYVKEMLTLGERASFILDSMLIPAINEVGRLFEQQKYFLPQLISSAETMKTAIDYLEPILEEDSTAKKAGKIVIATVAGDIHDIGKNLVALMLKNYGFDIIDLGKDVPASLIIETARKENADIIALSALMTTTMLEMKEVVRLRNEADLKVKIMIGGAVITQSYCDEIGADGYSKDAQGAVSLARSLIENK